MTVQPTSRITRGTALVGGLLIDGDESSPAGVINLVPRVVKIPLTLRSTGAHDTGVDLPTAGVVLDIWLDITTAESTGSTKTINVGLLAGEAGGDADGFIAGASTAAAVTVKPVLTNGAVTLGVLLKETLTGSGSATMLTRGVHVLNGTAKSVVYTLASTHTEVAGNIYISYIDMS
jgi:hypothetical protein